MTALNSDRPEDALAAARRIVEAAIELARVLGQQGPNSSDYDRARNAYEAAFRKAPTVARALLAMQADADQAYQQGRRQGLEEAAKIAENTCSDPAWHPFYQAGGSCAARNIRRALSAPPAKGE